MKKEVRQLKTKATNSLILCIDHFNRPWDQGRAEGVLILLDHAFEMLLKAAIRHRNGKIRKPRERQTIGFDACVRKALTEKTVQFLNDEQALTLQAINGQRDAAQHYLLDVSEHQLYFYAQAGVTLFRDIHDSVFDDKLVVSLPERVLPVSTTAPRDLAALFDKEVGEIQGLLAPGTRRRMDAIAKVRSLAVLEGAINGDYDQPGDSELGKLCNRLSKEKEWSKVFPGVASINVASHGEGPNVQLRLSKKEGIPVRLVREGEGGGAVVAVKRVDELGFYNMGLMDLSTKLTVSSYDALALIYHLKIQENKDYYKEIRIGTQKHKRYSQLALEKLEEEKTTCDFGKIRNEYTKRNQK